LKTCQQLYGVEPTEFIHLEYCEAIRLKKKLVFDRLGTLTTKMHKLLKNNQEESYRQYLVLNEELGPLERAFQHNEMLIDEMNGFIV